MSHFPKKQSASPVSLRSSRIPSTPFLHLIFFLIMMPTTLGAVLLAKVKELEAQTVAQASSDQKKEDARKAFATLAAAIDKVSGQSPGTQPADQFLKAERDALSKALADAEKVAGLQVYSAVLEDNRSDDVVRQEVFTYLQNRNAYSLSDLDVLCHLLVIDYGFSQVPQRAWVKPSTFRQRIGAWVGDILHVTLPETDEATSKVELESHPKEWVRAILNKAMAVEQDVKQKEVIRKTLTAMAP